MGELHYMSNNIHPTAIVHPKAQMADNVQVGPFSRIDENVKIGEGTQIGTHCVIEGWTTIGKNNKVFTGAVIGSIPQDLKYKGGKSFVNIGDNNVIREYVTVNPGTDAGTSTVIGNNNELMAYTHVAHDCILGNNIIIANLGTLAGYVTVEDRAIIGGLSAVHQFVRIGKMSIVGGCSKVTQDVTPYSMVDGHPAKLYAINNVGLLRSGISLKNRMVLKKAIRLLKNSEMSLPNALSMIEKECSPLTDEVQALLEFIRSSKRGIAR